MGKSVVCLGDRPGAHLLLVAGGNPGAEVHHTVIICWFGGIHVWKVSMCIR